MQTVRNHSRRNRQYDRPLSILKIKSMTSNLPKQWAPGPEWFTDKLHQTFRKEITPKICNLFWKIEATGIFPNSFDEANITLIPWQHKDTIKTEQKISEIDTYKYGTFSHVLFFLHTTQLTCTGLDITASLMAQHKKFTCNAVNASCIPGLRRSPGEGNVNLLQYSRLENPRDREAWQGSTVHEELDMM